MKIYNSSKEFDKLSIIPSVKFEREMREGLDDYRYMLTLARLADKKNDSQAKKLIKGRLDAFKLGDREHDAIYDKNDWSIFRRKMADEIERPRK